MKKTENTSPKCISMLLFLHFRVHRNERKEIIGETAGELGRSESKASAEKAFTFPCQLTVVWLFAGYYLLHQLVVAAVAHCLDNVMHLQTKTETVRKNIH